MKKGFTLVELLVVIGIIAVLISILLPSLARARDMANSVSCQSNLRQVYQAVLLYATENKGFLPYSEIPNGGIQASVTAALGGDPAVGWSPVLRCPSALVGYTWNQNTLSHYTFHPRMFPSANQQDLYPEMYGGTRTAVKQRNLAVKDAASKMIAWDGSQVLDWNYNAFPYAMALDSWRWFWGHCFAEPVVSWDAGRLDQPVIIGDGGTWQENIARNHDAETSANNGFFKCNMRFRHMQNTDLSKTAKCSIVFADGHVESRQINDVRVREVLVEFK